MELQHRFTVPAGVEETWATFTDIEGVAGCFPGATVTGADAESFTGTVKVKLGPIALVYNGTGTFVEKDEAARRLVIDAKGKDKRGNGTAGAMVTATMSEAAGGATDVEVSTDLSLTGKAAQFGRGGVIKDVSDKLLGQFVACLEQRMGGGQPAAAPEEPAPAPPTSEAAGTTAAATAVPDPGAPGVQDTPADGTASTATPDPAAPEPPRAAADVPPAPAADGPAPASPAPRPAQQDDAINLGTTVLPVLLRAYWKPALAVVVAIVVVLVLVL